MRVYPELLLLEKEKERTPGRFVYVGFYVSSEEASPESFGSKQITGRG